MQFCVSDAPVLNSNHSDGPCKKNVIKIQILKKKKKRCRELLAIE